MARGKTTKPIVTFNAGEFSPALEGRIDIEKMTSACLLLENVIIEHYGEARRRPGTKYIATVSNTYNSS